MFLVSFRLFYKNLGNLQEFFGQMDYRPPWQKIARTPMSIPREIDGNKFVGENLAGIFSLHSILAEVSKTVIPSY